MQDSGVIEKGPLVVTSICITFPPAHSPPSSFTIKLHLFTDDRIFPVAFVCAGSLAVCRGPSACRHMAPGPILPRVKVLAQAQHGRFGDGMFGSGARVGCRGARRGSLMGSLKRAVLSCPVLPLGLAPLHRHTSQKPSARPSTQAGCHSGQTSRYQAVLALSLSPSWALPPSLCLLSLFFSLSLLSTSLAALCYIPSLSLRDSLFLSSCLSAALPSPGVG